MVCIGGCDRGTTPLWAFHPQPVQGDRHEQMLHPPRCRRASLGLSTSLALAVDITPKVPAKTGTSAAATMPMDIGLGMMTPAA